MVEVAIGLPAYNRPQFLEAALHSLTQQTFVDFELLISDNASPDPEVRRIAEHFAKQDPRIRYVRQASNVGPVRNFSYVFEHTTAPLFMWASDDDLWEPTFIEQAVSALHADSSKSAWFCQMDRIDEHDRVTRTYPSMTRFNSRGDKPGEVRAFLLEPERRGKVNLYYAVFRRHAMLRPLELMASNFEMRGVDLVFVYAFFCRYDFLVDDKLLFHKRQVSWARRPVTARTGLRSSRHFEGLSAAAKGTPYYTMTRRLLPWRFLVDRMDKLFRQQNPRS